MANIKFSQFTEKTTLGTVDFLVGYTGAENVQISPTNLLSTFVSGSGAAGQVAYFDPSNNLAGENDFFWDYTNKRLGIGTTSPSSKLHVAADIRTDNSILFTGTGFINSNATNLELETVSNKDIILKPQGTGNVGISTTTPSAKLEVDGTLIATGVSQLGSGGSNVYLTSSSAGNVGIGTSSPTQKLDVNGAIITEDYRAASIFYLTSGDDWRFRSDTGSERMRVTSAGFVGIGTDSPSTKLHVYNGEATIASSTDGVKLSYSNGNSSGVIDTAFSDNALEFRTNGTSKMFIANAGNVGIGTTSPSVGLQLGNSTLGETKTAIFNSEGGGEVGLTIQSRTNRAKLRVADNDSNAYVVAEAGKAFFGTSANGDTTNITVLTSGNVGIGTTDPGTDNLRVSGTGRVARILSSNDSVPLVVQNSSGVAARIGFKGTTSTSDYHVSLGATGDNFNIYTNNTEKIRVTSAGNVGIGTSSPLSKLHVDSGGSDNVARFVSTDLRARVEITDSADASYFGTINGITFLGPDDTSGGNNINIISTGNVGIGTNSPYYKLDTRFTNTDTSFSGGSNGNWGSNGIRIENNSSISNTMSVIHLRNSDADIHIAGIRQGSDDSDLGFFFEALEKVRFTRDGNVGIGTTNPSQKLEIRDETATHKLVSINRPASDTAALYLGNDSASPANGVISSNYSDLIFGRDQSSTVSEWMRIKRDGNVGIGSTSPTSKLTVAVGDIETSGVGYGMILKSPDGTRYRVTVANGGTLSVSAV